MASRYITLVSVIACFGACNLKSSSLPLGAAVLPGTEDVAPQGDENFALSPDGQLLLYPSGRGSWVDPVFVLYDLSTHEGHDLPLDPETRALAGRGEGPLFRARCWDEGGRRIVFAGSGGYFVADIGAGAASLRWVAERDLPAMERRRFAALSEAPDDPHAVSVAQQAPTRAAIVRRSDLTVVAEHEPEGFLVTRLFIEHVTVSPDIRRVAYVVQELRGSFAVPARGYMVSLAAVGGTAGGPRLLGASVHGPMRWTPDSRTLYACVELAGRNAALVEWRLQTLTRRSRNQRGESKPKSWTHLENARNPHG
jgi:hypothetical protein